MFWYVLVAISIHVSLLLNFLDMSSKDIPPFREQQISLNFMAMPSFTKAKVNEVEKTINNPEYLDFMDTTTDKVINIKQQLKQKKQKAEIKNVLQEVVKNKEIINKEQSQSLVNTIQNQNSNKGLDQTNIFQKAKYSKKTPIIYPRKAIRKKQQGEVRLKVLVNKSGLVGEIKIHKSSGYEILDNAAIKTVKDWQFITQQESGKNINYWVIVPVTFKIKL